MKTSNAIARLTLLSASLLLSSSCDEPQAPEAAPDVAVSTQPLGISGGGVPLPIVPCASGDTTCDPTKQPVAWDGTYAELLAADALAECSIIQSVPCAARRFPVMQRAAILASGRPVAFET